jgi:hypothetical protein
MRTATQVYGKTLIIFEGRRLSWSSITCGRSVPQALWPSATELAIVRRHIADGEPLLIILDHSTGAVPLLAEEIPDLPPMMRQLVVRQDGELADLSVPLLDWLPRDLRERGISFLHASLARKAATPPPILPDLLVEDGTGAVRFASRVRDRMLPDYDITALADHLFHPATTAAVS